MMTPFKQMLPRRTGYVQVMQKKSERRLIEPEVGGDAQGFSLAAYGAIPLCSTI